MRFLFLIWLSLACVHGPSAGQRKYKHDTGGLGGLVTNAKTGAPLASAYVLLVRHAPDESTSGLLTDAEGRFEFVDLPPSSYAMMVEKSGYEMATAGGLEVTGARKAVVDIDLMPGEPEKIVPRADGQLIIPPAYLMGPDPQLTDQALLEKAQGQMLVRCIVSIEGRVRDCRAIKHVPSMDDAVISALQRRRYRPALRDGKPVEVDYTFTINLPSRAGPLPSISIPRSCENSSCK